MKKALLVGVLSCSLFSCSLLQRNRGVAEETSVLNNSEESSDDPLFTPTGQEISNSSEPEVARLNTKIAALETKLEVLTSNFERLQAQRSQPAIEAQPPAPQPSLAAPVDDADEIHEQTKASHISAAPAKPTHLPAITKAPENDPVPVKTSGAEKEFRSGMALFQNGQNLEAASRFALLAKKYPGHLLAAHALYWAGEASARGQQWSLAVDNWSELEKRYPRSAYLPEALSGLAKAHEAQGNASKAKLYRSMLVRAFPKSPAALRADSEVEPVSAAKETSSPALAKKRATEDVDESIPTFDASDSAEAGETP